MFPQKEADKTDFRFWREEHLKNRAEIGKVFKQGKSAMYPGVKLFVLQNGGAYNRIAFVFTRKFGNAVERNRSRRMSREAYRHLQHMIRSGFDMVLLVYPGQDDFSVRVNQLKAVFSKVDLLLVSESGIK
jgi:ribonuclease P protein component